MNTYQLFTVKINSIYMMQDRGFSLSRVRYLSRDEIRNDRDLLRMSQAEMLEQYPEISDLSAIYTHSRTGLKTLVMFAHSLKELDISTVREVMKTASDLYTQQKRSGAIAEIGLILISNNPLNAKSKSTFLDTDLPNIHRESFIFDQLMLNNSRIPGVPRSEVVPPEEVETLLTRLNFVDSTGYHPEKLPKLMDTDPQARWNGYRPGQIIRFHRIDPQIGNIVNGSLFYRLVISAEVVAKNRKVKVIGQDMQLAEGGDDMDDFTF